MKSIFYFVTELENIIQCILSAKLIAPQVFLFDNHAWKQDSTETVITAIIKCLSETYFLFRGLAWKCFVVYIICHKCTANIFVRLENIIPWRSLFATIYAYTIYLLVFIIRQTILTVRLKNMISIKQKFLIIVNVIYTARKIKWEMMWSSRNTKVLDSFSPQKWKVNTTCSMLPGHSVFRFTGIQFC